MSTVVGSGFVEMALDNSRLHRDLQAMKAEVAAATKGASRTATTTAAGVTTAQRTMFSGLASGLASAGGAVTKFSRGLGDLGRKAMVSGRAVTAFFSLPLAAFGAAAVKAAMALDKTFTQIEALSNATPAMVAEWRSSVMTLSHDTGVAANDLAQALYFLASAGLKNTQIFPTLTAAAQASAVGLGAAADVARITANALNAYSKEGLTAAHVTDILASAIKEGTAEPEEFSGALGRILPIAAKAGVSFDEVAASLASLSNIGLDVNEGVTAMRGLLNALYAPGTQAAKTLARIGLSAEDMRKAISEGGLLQALQMLEDATGGNIDVLDDIIPNIRALTGQFGLTGENAAQVANIFDRVKDSTGALGKAFETTAESKAFKLQQGLNDLKNSMIDIGNIIIPILVNDVLPVIKSIVDGFNGMSEGSKKIVVWAGLAVIALGPLMILLGGMSRLIGAVGLGIGKLLTLGAGAAGAGAATGAGAAAGGTLGTATAAGFAAKFNLLATAAVVGFLAGTWLDKKYHISDRIAEAIVPDLPTTKKGTDWDIDEAGFAKILSLQRQVASGTISLAEAQDQLRGFNVENDTLYSPNLLTHIRDRMADARHEVESIIGPLGEQQAATYAANMTLGHFDANLALLDLWLKRGQDRIKNMPPDLEAMRRAALESTAAHRAHVDASRDLEAKLRAQRLAAEGSIAPFQAMAAGERATARDARNATGAIDAYTGAIKGIPTQARTHIIVTGAQQAIDAMYAVRVAAANIPRTVGVGISPYGPQQAEGGIRGAANGAIMGAASGFLATKPTMLVAEGKYSTPLGPGAEAILPLNDEVMGRLAAAIIGGMKGTGGREIHQHFHQEMPPMAELVRAMSRELARSL